MVLSIDRSQGRSGGVAAEAAAPAATSTGPERSLKWSRPARKSSFESAPAPATRRPTSTMASLPKKTPAVLRM